MVESNSKNDKITVNSLLKFVLFMEIDQSMVKLTVLCSEFVCVCLCDGGKKVHIFAVN